MPRATWSGFLKLSLVSCPVYLAPATTETGRIRLNQLNGKTGNRVQQQLVDSVTGDVVPRDEIAKGYEFSKGRYVVIDDEELESLQVESSKVVELDIFVDRDSVDPVYVDAPYYLYPDGAMAPETFRVISEAMLRKNKVGLGRVTLSSRERQVLVEPRGAGLLMSTLRSGKEVKAAEFGAVAEADADLEMIAIAEAIIEKRSGKFDPARFVDRYQDALQELVNAKASGAPLAPAATAAAPQVIDLMEALRRSLAGAANANAPPASRDSAGEDAPKTVARKKAAAGADRRQTNLLLPVKGGKARKAEQPEAVPAMAVAEPAAKPARPRKKAG